MINTVNLRDLSYLKKTFLYKVELGDSLKSIADKFNTTQRVLIVINGLEFEPKVGEFIIVEKLEGESHVVLPLETLDSIAQKYNVSVQEIIRKNKTDVIFVGQKIYI